ETDPQVGNFTADGQVARWNSTGGYLEPGLITDWGTNVTIGTADTNTLTVNATSTFNADVSIGSSTTAYQVNIQNDGTTPALVVQAASNNWPTIPMAEFSGGTVFMQNTSWNNAPILRIENNDSSATGVVGLHILQNVNVSDYGLIVDATNQGSATDTRAAAFLAIASDGPSVYVENQGGGPGIKIDNSLATTPGFAISVADGGGAVKLSSLVDNVSGNAYTIPAGYSVVHITSDYDGNADTITLPAGTDGQFLYIIYVPNNDNNADNAVIRDGTRTIYTTTQSAQLTLVYVNGRWYVVSVVE
ncbi:MAG: hypothetical protein ACPLX7_10170, partial [Candidatus Kapaibacteriota bacterium]